MYKISLVIIQKSDIFKLYKQFGHFQPNYLKIHQFFANCQNILKTHQIVPIFTHNSQNCLKIYFSENFLTHRERYHIFAVYFSVFPVSHYVIFALCRITLKFGSFSHFVPLMVYLYTYTIKTPFWGKFGRFTYALLHRYINTALFIYFSSFLYCFGVVGRIFSSRMNFEK